MAACHQHHNIPWNLLKISPVRRRKSNSSHYDPRTDLVWPENSESNFTIFAGGFEKTLLEFATTESAKYDRLKISKMDQAYPASVAADLLLEEYQSVDRWNKLIHHYKENRLEFRNVDGAVCEIIKELFNRDMMDSLLFLARFVSGLENLSFATYSNFFHYGYQRTIEDAIWWYILSNYLIMKNEMNLPKGWPHLDFLDKQDFDSSLTFYRKHLGDYINTPPSEETIKVTQSFAFKKMYQYQVFWEELRKYSDGSVIPIDWKNLITTYAKDVVIFCRVS